MARQLSRVSESAVDRVDSKKYLVENNVNGNAVYCGKRQIIVF